MFRLCLNRIIQSRLQTNSCLRPCVISRWPSQSSCSLKNYHSFLTNRPLENPSLGVNFALTRLQTTTANQSDQPQTEASDARRAENAIYGLEQLFSRFEEKCQIQERVNEKEFVKVFDTLTRTVERIEGLNQMTKDVMVNLSLLAAILIRCCGKLMSETPEKARELLAGNLWQYIKEKKIPLDISHYNSLIRVLNENQTNYDPEKMLEEMHSSQLTPDRVTYQRLIHQYCMQGNVDGATKLLEKMKDLEMELNELTFASLILGYGKQENPPATEEMFELMRTNGVEPGSRSYAAAITAQIGLLPKSPSAIDEIKKLHELIENENIQFTTHEAGDLLNVLLPHKDNNIISGLIEFVLRTSISSVNAKSRIIGILLRSNDLDRASRVFWSHRPSTRAIESGRVGSYYIKQLAQWGNIPVDFAIAECSKLKDMQYNSKAHHNLYYSAAENGNLQLVRASLQKIGEEDKLKVHYYWPLLAQANNEEEVVKVLKEDLKPNMNSSDLLETFSQWVWPKFSENFSRLFELNKDLKYDTNILTAAFLSYSIQNNKIMDALEFISKAPEDLLTTRQTSDEFQEVENLFSDSRVPSRGRSANDRDALIGRMLNQIADETKDPVLVEKAFNLCKLPGQAVTSRSGTALVKVHLLNNDHTTALDKMFTLAKEYRITPCKKDLIIHCLEKKDTDNLQNIMDISTEIHGESNALFDLAICCLEIGKLKQAQKIFVSPGFRVNPLRIYQAARLLAGQSKINVLENLVHLARDVYDVDTEYLYQTLINVYDQNSNGKKVLDLWNRMQEEEFQPSKKSLVMIANVLEKNRIEVPFQKPKMGPKSEQIMSFPRLRRDR